MLQCVGLFNFFGIRMPVMMGVTFISIGPILCLLSSPLIGITHLFGASIVAGIFGLAIAPFLGNISAFFPKLVTGSIITTMGLSLMTVAIRWSNGFPVSIKDPNSLNSALALHQITANWIISVIVFCIIFVTFKFCRGFFASMAILIGMAAGVFLSLFLIDVDMALPLSSPWFEPVFPFYFGLPAFELSACISLCITMLILMIESIGTFMAIGEIIGKPVDRAMLKRGLRVDALGAIVGGIFNSFPYTSYNQNVGLLYITGVYAPAVCAIAGFLLMGLGLFPKLAQMTATIPYPVLGGMGFFMFGMIVLTGCRMLCQLNLRKNPSGALIAAASIAAGLIPMVVPEVY